MKKKTHRPPGRPRTEEKGHPTHKLVLEAAVHLFLDNGYQEVSIDDVAKACGVTKATVYYYYATKAELFTESMIHMMERIRRRIVSMLKEDIPLRNRLLKVAEAHLQATLDVDLEGFMRGAKNALSDDQIRQIREAEEQMYQSIEEAFTFAVEQGEITDVNPTFAAHAYISLLKIGNYRDADNQPIFPTTRETADQIIGFFWNGLFPPDR
ncbi:MAG TPA: TetR/AcrR family transcriptional regulator [Bacillales bacterium]